MGNADAAFKDHFSSRSDRYARYRPLYPAALYDYLAGLASKHDVAWDCATGNGQAAVALAGKFHRVFATDASTAQIEAAAAHPRVEYSVSLAESSGLPDDSVDLLTVGQAYHWFDQPAFLAEAQRVLRRQGVLAVWCYEICRTTEDCDAIIDHLYREIVGDYWPLERAQIERGYDDINLNGMFAKVPEFTMSLHWSADDMLGYLGTWSACQRYQADQGADPVVKIADDLKRAWGGDAREVVWPLKLQVGRPNSLLE